LAAKGKTMPFKPNYRAERAQKSRVKDEKKQEKLRRREEASSKRKASREGEADPDGAEAQAVATENQTRE
jgi:hypothetical protein